MNASLQFGPGSEIGGYRIIGRLGHGAMAEVYDAVDSTGHAVALKLFRAGGGVSPTMLERFRREAEAAKKLRCHPNVLTVYATGHEGDYHFIAMERVEDSRTLETLISGGAAVNDLLRVAIKVASALHYAHEHAIIHRDVKPSNIMLDNFKEPLLADFGVAELTDWPSCTLSGALTGTPIYMSPEQARSERVEPSADVYSLAVVLYEALTGELPYELPEAPSTALILEAVKHQDPIRPRKRSKRINRDLDFVLLKALRKKPVERYQSAREFAYDLEAVLEGRAVTGRWVSPWTSSSHWVRRNRTLLAGVLALLAVVGVVAQEVSERFREERYRNLVTLAVKASYQIKNATDGRETEPLLRSARRAMAVGKWIESRDLFQAAVEVNRKLHQSNAQAGALLEWARCETMLHNSLRARELYAELLELPHTGSAVRQLAAFEMQVLLLLEGNRAEAETLRDWVVAETPDGMFVTVMDVALGRPPADWDLQKSRLNFTLKTYAFIAEAVASRSASGLTSWRTEVEEEQKQWPLPLLDYLLGRLR